MKTIAERAQVLLAERSEELQGQENVLMVLTYLSIPLAANSQPRYQETRKHAAILDSLELLLDGPYDERQRQMIVESFEGMITVSMLTAVQRLRDEKLGIEDPEPPHPPTPKKRSHLKAVP